ncbi:ABC transporter ATP-binding protein [uncultured Agrococcus sp.]|uniref:ABC transporter ATP-binding protein n=1 Tax=uncultured Agrococcus sp. TaxID=382258 RepID=UPI0025F4A7D8|nr:ABC transporter ATP-binding protein [uncultured Agrococcus sp.]
MTDQQQHSASLALRHLTKRFGPKVAADDVSLDVPVGSMFGLLGPNGAGKTTTLSMTTGLLRPDAGTAFVLGANVWEDPAAAKGRMGVLPEAEQMFNRLTGRELLRYTGLLRGMAAEDVVSRTDELLEALGLTDAASKLVVDYSSGMTKKIGLASALIHAPRLLILDEPFESVDPVSGETIRSILRSYVAGGGTVVLSSHVMELVENLCDHVAIMAEGRVLAAGTLDDVRAGQSLQERFLGMVGVHQLGEESLSWLRS